MTTSGRPTSGARRSSCSFRRRCSARPWSWSSRKKPSLPKISPYWPATLRACSQSSTSSALATSPPRHADRPIEALAVLREMVVVDARLVVVAVDMGVGDQAAQVLVAAVVLREEDQVVRLGVGLALLRGHRARRDVRLHADDRLDALVLRRLVERDGAVERAVVRDRHRIHARLGRRIDQLRDPAEAVEEAEFGVDVEMREVVRGDRHREANGSRPAARRRLRPGRVSSQACGRSNVRTWTTSSKGSSSTPSTDCRPSSAISSAAWRSSSRPRRAPDAAPVGRRPRPVRPVPGRAAHELCRRERRLPEQDHALQRPAPAGVTVARRIRPAGRWESVAMTGAFVCGGTHECRPAAASIADVAIAIQPAKARPRRTALGARATLVRSDRGHDHASKLIPSMIAIARGISDATGAWWFDRDSTTRTPQPDTRASRTSTSSGRTGAVDAFVQSVGTAHRSMAW